MSITADTQGGIAVITLDDGKANVVNPPLLDALNAALDEAEANASAIVLTGRSGVFSAGFDLNILNPSRMDEAVALVKYGGRTALRIYGSPKPIVAACTGHAIAMGSFLLASSDYRVGAAGPFKLGANESAIGMVVPYFASELLKARIAKPYLTATLVNATLYQPEEAKLAGFLDVVAPADTVMELAMAEAEKLSALIPSAFHGNKQLMRADLIADCQASVQP